VRKLIAPLERWTDKEQTRAEVEVRILDHLFQVLPTPPFSAMKSRSRPTVSINTFGTKMRQAPLMLRLLSDRAQFKPAASACC
jgi:hypothetical protein